MSEKLRRLGSDLEEITISMSASVDFWTVSKIRDLLQDLPPETTVQEIVDALEEYQ